MCACVYVCTCVRVCVCCVCAWLCVVRVRAPERERASERRRVRVEEERGRERRCGGQDGSGRDGERGLRRKGRETLSRTARLQSERPCKSASTASKNLRSCKSANRPSISKRDLLFAYQKYQQKRPAIRSTWAGRACVRVCECVCVRVCA